MTNNAKHVLRYCKWQITQNTFTLLQMTNNAKHVLRYCNHIHKKITQTRLRYCNHVHKKKQNKHCRMSEKGANNKPTTLFHIIKIKQSNRENQHKRNKVSEKISKRSRARKTQDPKKNFCSIENPKQKNKEQKKMTTIEKNSNYVCKMRKRLLSTWKSTQ